jgi:hypothetical protein
MVRRAPSADMKPQVRRSSRQPKPGARAVALPLVAVSEVPVTSSGAGPGGSASHLGPRLRRPRSCWGPPSRSIGRRSFATLQRRRAAFVGATADRRASTTRFGRRLAAPNNCRSRYRTSRRRLRSRQPCHRFVLPSCRRPPCRPHRENLLARRWDPSHMPPADRGDPWPCRPRAIRWAACRARSRGTCRDPYRSCSRAPTSCRTGPLP